MILFIHNFYDLFIRQMFIEWKKRDYYSTNTIIFLLQLITETADSFKIAGILFLYFK